MNNQNKTKIVEFQKNDIELLIAFFNQILKSPYNFGDNFYSLLVKNNPALEALFGNTHRTNLGYVFFAFNYCHFKRDE